VKKSLKGLKKTKRRMVVHILSLGLAGWVVYLASPGTDLFSWHPSLMVVSFALLMAQAIIIFSPESSLFLNSRPSDKVQLHWILNLFSLFGALGGFGAIYLNKEIVGKKHFTTWHGTVGLAAIIGLLVAAAWGLAAKYSIKLSKYMRPINTKLYHATLALIVFCLGMSAISLACYSAWLRKRVGGYLWRIMFATPIVLAVCMMRQVTQSYLPRVVKVQQPQQEKKTKEQKKQKSN